MRNGLRTENSLKAYQMSCLLIFTPIYTFTRLIGLAVEMYRTKRLLNFLETHTLLIQQKITEKVALYTNNKYKVTVSMSWTIIILKKKLKKSLIIIKK